MYQFLHRKLFPPFLKILKNGKKKVNFGSSIGMDVVNFIEPNFIEFILGPI